MASSTTVAAVLLVCARIALSWKQCDDVVTTGKFTHMELSPCTEDQLPCKLVKGTSPRIDLSFKPAADTASLSIAVTAFIAEMELPFPGLANDACNPQFGIECPLKKNVEYTYSNQFTVYALYPELKNLTTKWQLKDSNGEAIVCLLIPVSITPSQL